jgi:predicted metal-dependent hydrolase
MAVASQGKSDFKLRVQQWAEKLDIQVTAISIRSMQNKWASCSTNGRLNFDSSLLELPPDLQDYIIVHELLHFRVPNHGKLWKALMIAYLGDYTKQEFALAQIATQNWHQKQ